MRSPLLLLLAGCLLGIMFMGFTDRAPDPMYEYRIVQPTSDVEATLNRQAEYGWRLVTVTHHGAWVFERTK